MRDRLAAGLDRVPPIVRSIAAVVAFLAVATWLTVTTWDQLIGSRLDVGPLTDFRDAIYYPLVALRDGVNPYNVDEYYRYYPVGQEFPLYTPVHLVVHSPLLLFSFPVARAVAFGWNLVLVLVFAGVVLWFAGVRRTVASVFGVGTLILLSDPGRFDLRTGQPTLIIVIAVTLALATRGDRATPREDGAGPSQLLPFVVGIASIAVVWSKPTFAIPLVVLLIARARIRLAIVGTAVAAAISALMLVLLVDAAGSVDSLVTSWRESAEVTSRSAQSRVGSAFRIDFASAFVRISRLRISEAVATTLGLALLAGGAWLVYRLHRRFPAGDREELTIALICIVIVSCAFHVWYDNLLLIVPLALLARRRPTVAIAWPKRVRTVVTLLLLVVVVEPIGWSPVNRILGKSGFEWMLRPTMLSVYVLTALGLVVWTALRQLADSVVPTTPSVEAAP